MPGTNLTRSEARERAALISVERYDVDLHLGRGPSTFTSRTTVRFRCAKPGASTFIDLIADSVESVTLNGSSSTRKRVADSRVALPGLATDNVLTIGRPVDTCAPARLHRFVDPVDSEVYLYSQFEVPDSRRMFAVFEQPDLKAEFSFTVTAPAGGRSSRSCLPPSRPRPGPGRPASAPGAGDLGLRTDAADLVLCHRPARRPLPRGPRLRVDPGREIPLGVFCQTSLLEHLDADNILDATSGASPSSRTSSASPIRSPGVRPGLRAGYNMGAMENAGAVTITGCTSSGPRSPRRSSSGGP